jgi:hypothetical protein
MREQTLYLLATAGAMALIVAVAIGVDRLLLAVAR